MPGHSPDYLELRARYRAMKMKSKAPGEIAALSGPMSALLLLPCLLSPGVAATSSDKVTYNRDIRPILSDNCFFCHGPDQKKRKAKLRLDVREEALSKKAIVPDHPEDSEL